MFNFRFNFNFIPIESDFIENLMPNANGEYIKVYLYILNMAVKGESAEPRIIAKKLNLLESDVINAIEYWQEKGVLSSDGETVVMGNTAVAADTEYTPAPSETPDPARTKKSASQIKENPLSDKVLSEITSVAEDLLGKTLSDSDIRTLYWFYDELGFSAELIMMLLEYCISKDKRDMRYIEKVAIAWHEKNIRDISAAEAYMRDETQMNKAVYELRKLFGITDRKLSKTEETYMSKWLDKYKMSVEMVALAYEYCIMAIGKMTFQYMDKIIENWYNAGISTIDAAEKEHEDFKNRSKKFSETDSSVYDDDTDYAEFERRMNEKY